MTFDDFLKECEFCGGNWTAMFITGIRKVAPKIYEQMPDRIYSFSEITFIVNHLCEDRPHFRYNLDAGNIIEFSPKGEFKFYPATDEMGELSMKKFYIKYNGMKEEDFED